jgi:hypothetical protein
MQRISRLVQREASRSIKRECISPEKNVNDWPLLRPCRSLARTGNWNIGISTGPEFDSRRTRFAWFAASMTLAGTCYGGLHLAAWKTPFASNTEALLWRAAGVSIMTPGPLCILAACLRPILFACSSLSHKLYLQYGHVLGARPIPNNDSRGSRAFLNAVTGIFFLSCLILWYIFCRVFIIVESFIMLAHIPDQALQVPTWSAYIPHIV